MTQKSHPKTELAVHKSHLGIKKDAYFIDGCAILWVVAWPGASNAVSKTTSMNSVFMFVAIRCNIFQPSAALFLQKYPLLY